MDKAAITCGVALAALGLTERSVRRIIADLSSRGYVKIIRAGRANSYEVNSDLTLRRPT